MIGIGDTVILKNLDTDEVEQYTIVPTFHNYKPVGYDIRKGNNFGDVIYRDELLSDSDVENGIILSECELAKKLLGRYEGGTITLIGDDLKPHKYKIIKIIEE